VILVLVFLVGVAPAWAQRADLARARTFYNQRQLDAAIEAATAAQRLAETQDAAAVVLARAHLERYRERANPADLAAARAALGTVRTPRLTPADRVDLLMALGEALFFEDDYGAAAQVFESGLESARAVGAGPGESMLDWWGSAVERSASALPRAGRARVFERLAERMSREILQNPASAVAGYWVVAAARGSGDPVAAWDAAIASWVRARLTGERASTLRADLDRLVMDGIIPDRVGALPADRRPQAEADLRAEWALVKERWR
jgi:hypothetical protein